MTLVLLCAVGTLLVLANLSVTTHGRIGNVVTATGVDLRFDAGQVEVAPFGACNLSYGWPLRWQQYIGSYPIGIVGWSYSAGRLAGNVAMWLVMLAMPVAACEWLLRRYRPRLRWGLRTMFAAVSILALFLGWFVAVRNRADEEDVIIEAVSRQVWLERWGPSWLDLIGADRYRRRIVGAWVRGGLPHDHDAALRTKETLALLVRLPKLRFLFVDVSELSPDVVTALEDFHELQVLGVAVTYGNSVDSMAIDGLANTLTNMPRLRALGISPLTMDRQVGERCLAAIADATQIEYLHLDCMTIPSESLACLGGFANLKRLSFQQVHHGCESPDCPPLLSHLPVLKRLERVDVVGGFSGCQIGDDDLPYLARLPCLKSLGLTYSYVTGSGLAELASSQTLEEVSLTEVSPETLKSLLSLKHLKRLEVPQDALKTNQRGWQALRQANPGLIIKGAPTAHIWWDKRILIPSQYEGDVTHSSAAREGVRLWKEAGRPAYLSGKTGTNQPNDATDVGTED